ncbi:MAG TPA: hypothetical protein VGD11_12450 [Mycobacteriales bacterium]
MSRREVPSGHVATGRGRIRGGAAVVNYDGSRPPRVIDGATVTRRREHAHPSEHGRYVAAESPPNSPPDPPATRERKTPAVTNVRTLPQRGHAGTAPLHG